MSQKPTIFICYSRKDTEWRKRLVSQLSGLWKAGLCEVWYDELIVVGATWNQAIEAKLQSADMAVLLVSADFLGSDYIMDKELPIFQERRIQLVPILVRPCDLDPHPWLKGLQFMNPNLPLSGDANWEQVLCDVARTIGKRLHPQPGTQATAALGPENITLAKLPVTDPQLFGREKELAQLHEAWRDKKTRIISLVAWGGVGKTALTNTWLNQMGDDQYKGAARVYGWSFYSQGSSEERNVSADLFLDHALRWFGCGEIPGNAWERGVKLAELIRKKPTLMVLDGLEPMQYPPGTDMEGQLRDQGLQALLKELARDNSGLMVISTRMQIADLNSQEGAGVVRVSLEKLTTEAGVQLLREKFGILGTDKELRDTVEEHDGHALALNLLGGYLKTVHKGEIRKQDLVPALPKTDPRGRHAMKVMASYEAMFERARSKGFLGFFKGKPLPELNILYMLGLFDRPADDAVVAHLLKGKEIKHLTTGIRDLDDTRWQYALQHLRELGLLAGDGRLDCHPLVREYFGARLKAQWPQAWREAHLRLYHYYRDLPEKEHPDTLAEMEPLFAAIAHGCRGGQHQEVLDEVYYPRIQRDGVINYCCNKLGAFGSDLAALSHFFTRPWRQSAEGLTDEDKSVVLSWAGFRLRALGRLREAAEPMEVGLELREKQENWAESSRNAGNLSELYLTLGEVARATDLARRAVTFADRSGDDFLMEVYRTTLADALQQAGERDQARGLFHQAETMQRERQPQNRFLYSLRGYRYNHLLLDLGLAEEVVERAQHGFKIAERNHWLLHMSLGHLALGRAVWQRDHDRDKALHHLNHAVAGLREYGSQAHLPRGLLARAAGLRQLGQASEAKRDLIEAFEIAERGQMRLHLLDCHLEAHHQTQDPTHLKKAHELIKQTGLHRDLSTQPQGDGSM